MRALALCGQDAVFSTGVVRARAARPRALRSGGCGRGLAAPPAIPLTTPCRPPGEQQRLQVSGGRRGGARSERSALRDPPLRGGTLLRALDDAESRSRSRSRRGSRAGQPPREQAPAPYPLPLPPSLPLPIVKSPKEGPAAQRWVPQGASFAPRPSPPTSRHLQALLFSGGRWGMQGGQQGGLCPARVPLAAGCARGGISPSLRKTLVKSRPHPARCARGGISPSLVQLP